MLVRLVRCLIYPTDMIVSAIILIHVTVVLFLVIRLRRPGGKPKWKRRLVCLNPMTWEDIQKKGVVEHALLLNRDNYWERFYLVHPMVSHDQEVHLRNNITILEFKGDRHPRLRGIGFRALSRLSAEFDFVRLMTAFIRENEVAVIKSQEPYLMGARSLVLKATTGCPVVEDIRCDYDLSYKNTGKPVYRILKLRRLEKILEKTVLRNVDAIFAGNEHLRQYALRNGASPKKTFTVRPIMPAEMHLAPLSERRNLRKELGVNGKKAILYCGRLHPEKNSEDVVRALPYVQKEFPQSILLLVGDGPQREELKELARQLAVSHSIVFLGFQRAEQVRDLLYSADVIVATLMGSALVESALSSRPVVAYDVEWHSELIRNEETGLLVPYKDYKAMAFAILRVLRNPREADSWGKNAREYALLLFNRKRILSIERESFETVLDGGHD